MLARRAVLQYQWGGKRPYGGMGCWLPAGARRCLHGWAAQGKGSAPGGALWDATDTPGLGAEGNRSDEATLASAAYPGLAAAARHGWSAQGQLTWNTGPAPMSTNAM